MKALANRPARAAKASERRSPGLREHRRHHRAELELHAPPAAIDRLHVLIIPDKFKGTLTANQAAQAIARGWHKARPGDSIQMLPMSDGGDGFGEVMRDLLGAAQQTTRTVNAAHRPCRAKWWWEPASRTAVIESAAVIGLAMLPPGKDGFNPHRCSSRREEAHFSPSEEIGASSRRLLRVVESARPPGRFHPFNLDSWGLGAVLEAAAVRGARRCLLGIGGSATNDGGFGLARALGWKFLDRRGAIIERWTDFAVLWRIVAPQRLRWFNKLLVAADVQNPLLGARGATRVYGPQKGLREGELLLAERCLRRLARVVRDHFGRDFACEPGDGAAGGLGFGLRAFAGAELALGFDLFARQASLERKLNWANLVITGEGALDQSTLMGKGVGRIAQRCRELQVPCIALAGSVAASPSLRRAFTAVASLAEVTTIREAKAEPMHWLARLAELAAKQELSSNLDRAINKARQSVAADVSRR